jgi:gliding motility-associated peptidyl-prolyl isomerase
LNKSEEELFEEFIAKDSLTDYIVSSSGFWYTYNFKSANDYSPQLGDEVIYTFEVLDLDQNVIYSFEEIGEKSYFVDQQTLEEGLRIGLKLMHEGDFVTFLFPSHKVFGYLGDENKIGIHQPLIYKVKLNKISRKNESN